MKTIIKIFFAIVITTTCAIAQEMIDDNGNAIVSSSKGGLYPPVLHYYFPSRYVRIDAMSNDSEPRLENNPVVGDNSVAYTANVPAHCKVAITHVAALSTATMEDYVKQEIDSLTKGKVASSSVKSKINSIVATLELPEIILFNKRCHLYARILRVDEGFTTILGMAECKDWDVVSPALISCVNSAKIVRPDLLQALEKYHTTFYIAVDKDGDYFEYSYLGYDPVERKNWGRTGGRWYYLNHQKSFPHPDEHASQVE